MKIRVLHTGKVCVSPFLPFGGKNADGRFVLLFSDGGYAEKSWKEMILPGISLDREAQFRSLKWIREQSLNPNCVASLTSHDSFVRPGAIEF